MDRPEPQAEQGLREADRNERGVRLGGYDASDGKTIGSLMRLFRRFLRTDPDMMESQHRDPANDALMADLSDRLADLKRCSGAECRSEETA